MNASTFVVQVIGSSRCPWRGPIWRRSLPSWWLRPVDPCSDSKICSSWAVCWSNWGERVPTYV